MLILENDYIVWNRVYCQQCGTCKGVCPNNAINADLTKEGLYTISINNKLCTHCRRCIKNCPATILFRPFDIKHYLKSKALFLGYAKNEDIRKRASSGGVARTFIVEGLKNNIFDGAYALKEIKNYPFAEGFFYTSNDSVKYCDIPNSIYHPILANSNINQIKGCGNLLVIGKPCQLAKIDNVLNGLYKEIFKVAIFCKQQKTFGSTRFLAKMMRQKVDINKPFYLKYRGEGWPGFVKVNSSKLFYQDCAGLPFGRRLWTVPGCKICGNPFGSNVDITLLDPWNIEKQDKCGKNLIVVHSINGEKLIEKFRDYLVVDRLEYEKALPALMLDDIRMKQSLIPFYKGTTVNNKIYIAGILENIQQQFFSYFLTLTPKLPLIFYKLLNKLPDFRNILLK